MGSRYILWSSKNWRDIASSSDGTKLVAATFASYIYTSIDRGVSWTQRATSDVWEACIFSDDGTKLAAVVSSGNIGLSTDSGVNWTEKTVGGGGKGWIDIVSSSDGTVLQLLLMPILQFIYQQ